MTESKKRKCAYCEKDKKLTKEHIWPNCILKKMPELGLKYLAAKNIVIPAELVISDVCKECNNNLLSPLDAYLCQIFDSYFTDYIEADTTINFEYEYDLLIRALLKITYNSSRTISRDNNEFEKYKNYILNGGETREDIAIILETIKPTVSDGVKIYPKSARCGSIQMSFPVEHFNLRMISINSYYFYLIISKEESISTQVAINEFQQIIQNIPGSVINPYKKVEQIKCSITNDTASLHLPHLKSNEEIYKKAIEKKKK